MEPRFTEEAMQNYIPVPESGCWLWLGGWLNKNYGVIQSKKPQHKNHTAHRVFYIAHVGLIPDGMHVCHKCDTPPCVNPAHLFLGTNSDNVNDRVRKGRTSGGKGERNRNATLTADQVREIRASNESPRPLAKKYGVNRNTIHSIRNGSTWRSVK